MPGPGHAWIGAEEGDAVLEVVGSGIGVVDAGLGAAFGIDIRSSDEEIEKVARTFRAACADGRTS